jgi:large subunit ribosomal protein L10
MNMSRKSMENPRAEKVAVVDEVKARLQDADAAFLTEYRGLTVKDLATLRGNLRANGADYKIYKNTLVRFAVRDLDITGVEDSLTGPTAIAFVKGDAAAAAKSLRDFAKTNPNLVVKGGVLGTKTLSAKDAAALADLPPREVVLAQLAGLLAQPMQQFASLLQTLPRNFAYGLKALADKGGAGNAPAQAAEVSASADVEAPAAEASEEAASAAEETTES